MLKDFDEGLDELAARSHGGLPLRLPVTVAVAIFCAQLLPWTVCAAWCGCQFTSEAISWIFSRRQFKGEAADRRARLGFLATMASGCAIWTSLGVMLWSSATPTGAILAVMIWLAVICFAQTNAYQSPLGFFVGGAAPGIFLIGFLAFGPNPLHLPKVPVVGMMVLTLGFAAEGVLKMLGARRRFNDAQAGLAASEAQYRVLADHSTDVITLNALDGSRVYVSPSAERMLGYSPDELFNENYDCLHPDDAQWLPRAIARMLAGGEEAATLQYRLIHKDGHPIWVETHFGVIRPEGSEPKLLSVCRNIEARKTLETELVDARLRAEAAAAVKSDFLANMTHELRTPLNAIIGFSGVLKASPRLASEDARHVGLIHDASGALLELVNSVLDFSKLEAGAVELEARPFDPAAAARSMASLMAEQANAKGLDLRVETQGEMAPLVGDAARIRQVVLNFLSNALKFTDEGAITLTVAQTPNDDEGRQGRLRISVTDTGVGVSPDMIDHLFDRFTQADASVSRRYGGTGLGLAICRRTAELMGGAVGCDSAPGQGATFWFELVLPRAEALPEPAPEVRPETLDGALRLLVVEDVAVNRELITTLLAPFDVEVRTAENGAEAVEAMAEDRFDIVLMDVQMPVMDGLTATRHIRALPHPHALATPIIAMTANVLPEQVATCLAAGMDDHLGKPISPAALLAILSRWSGGREAAGETLRATG